MDFSNHILYTFQLFGTDVYFTETIFNTYIIMIFLTIFAIIVRVKLNKFSEVPTGFQNFVELIIETMDNFVISVMDEKYRKFAYWFFTVFVVILCSNLSGLFGLRPPTADLSTTAAFGLSTFLLMQVLGIATQPKAYFKGFFEPYPPFVILNITGFFAPLISLSFRLFGNILGGTIIMGLVYSLPAYIKVGIPAVLHIYFDLFAGVLQSFIFVMLSMTFIRDKLPD